MSLKYPDLSDYLAVAAAVTGIDLEVLLQSTKLDLADSALHAPAGSWGDEEFYPDFVDKAAVLIVRLAKNHPLLDGNKRAAWVTLRLFTDMDEWAWQAHPDVDEAEQAVLAVAAGDWDVERVAAWLRPMLLGPPVLD